VTIFKGNKMNTIQTQREIILAQILERQQSVAVDSRELVIANTPENTENTPDLPARTTSRAREVYKDKKSKIQKHISRVSEERSLLTPSPLGEEVSPEGLEAQEENVSNLPPATTSSRVTGISVQHVKTTRGIKLTVAVQTAADAESGEYVELTAELKRHSRLRELKRYAGDDYDFEQLYINYITELKTLSPAAGKDICMGRLHIRGARGKWFANMAMVGFVTDGVVRRALLYINTAEYEIELTGLLSPRQEQLYHSTGIYGQLISQRPTPRLETAARRQFNP